MTGLNLDDLMAYTEWERELWHDFFRQHGAGVLDIEAGAHGDGRFQRVGDLLQHVFGAEKRYVERLSDRPLTAHTSMPANDVEALFQFGRQSRKELRELIESYPRDRWDEPRQFRILEHPVTASPRKIVVHVLLHEIRHWAQIATLLRLQGKVPGFHDFLFSPVLGGNFKNSEKTSPDRE